MASGLVVHLEVGGERHTELLTRPRVRIGAGESCDLRLAAEAVPAARDLLIELDSEDGHYRVADFDPTLDLTLNGNPLRAGAIISDGDKVQLPADALTMRFFPVEAPGALVPERRNGAHVAPFIETAALEAAATARRDDAKVFLREFTRELVSEIKLSTKLLVFLFALALVGGTLYIGFAAFKELQQSRRRLEEQNAEIARLNEQVRQSQSQFSQVTQTNNDIINSLSLAPTIRAKFGSGVCLISGVYIFVEQGTGRPLRYPEPTSADQTSDPSATPSDTQTTFLTPDGKGPIAEFPYVGTGFHVGGGYVLTNRHVASEPWQADERSMVFGSSASGKPKLTRLLAYFPGQPQPFALKVKQVSQRDDLAVCQIDAAQLPTNIPTLLLDENTDAATVGKPVVLMGYPSGPDRILASLPDEVAASIKQRYGSSLDVLVSHLAERNLIKPLTTQGHVADVETRRIIYDARTGEGGSGAPLFGQSGRVIGVNFAVFTEITDANFAVPVRFAQPLLERAGWTPPTPPAEAKSEAKETKTAAVADDQKR